MDYDVAPTPPYRELPLPGGGSCHVDVAEAPDLIIVKFFDAAREQSAGQIVNLVVVDAGYGTIWYRKKDNHSALLGGHLLEAPLFLTRDAVHAAIDFVKSLRPSWRCYTPHGIEIVARRWRVEYNGEY